jgi:hypothetical protein
LQFAGDLSFGLCDTHSLYFTYLDVVEPFEEERLFEYLLSLCVADEDALYLLLLHLE